jgi:uncharacterized protein with FMN-binding domain
MKRSLIRNAGLSLALCAGLAFGASSALADYADGTYTAEGKGIGGKVPVTVVIEKGAIASVEIGENGETQGIGSKAIEQLPAKIVEANGIEGVDGVSGASVTSKAIFTAMTTILEEAQAGEADEDAAKEAGLKDGTYEASAKGIGGKVPLTVEIKDGKIVSVEVGENGETQGIGSKAIEQLPAKIIEAQGIEGVDGVSGASVTSKAIFTAMADILEQAAAPATDEAAAGAYKDGTYEASAKGIGGKVPLTVEIKDGKIVSVEVGENGETQGIGSKAIEQLPAKIVEANGIEGVDGVSGASVTSKAIFTAMADILEQAKA